MRIQSKGYIKTLSTFINMRQKISEYLYLMIKILFEIPI